MDAKCRESNPLNGFPLDVGENKIDTEDAQWIAIGK